MPHLEQQNIRTASTKIVNGMASAIPWTSLAAGGALVAISIWGFWVCRSLSRSGLAPAEAGVNNLVMVLSWLVLFAPAAFAGGYLLRSTLKQMRMIMYQSRSATSLQVQIVPPPSKACMPDSRHILGSGETDALDDATVSRLNRVADRTARIFSVGLGLFLLVAGLSGFIAVYIYGHSKEIVNFPLVSGLLVGCGLATLLGLAILRDVFKNASTERLGPLRVFTAIVSRRVAEEESARRYKNKPRKG